MCCFIEGKSVTAALQIMQIQVHLCLGEQQNVPPETSKGRTEGSKQASKQALKEGEQDSEIARASPQIGLRASDLTPSRSVVNERKAVASDATPV
jgi:hypothetical protein